MIRFFILAIGIMYVTLAVNGQSRNFRSPINHETILSGSFAEPRSRHFHAGIDYKPYNGVPFDTIYSVADGWISRISVRPDGYGKALYIDHPTGHTSVYAHLHEFTPGIQQYIEDLMYKKKRHSIQHYPEAGELRVSKGDYIGIMGNSGRSSGPHLHFEMRKSARAIPINPAKMGFAPRDDMIPTIRGIVVYVLTPGEEVISKEYYPAFALGKGRYSLNSNLIRSGGLLVGLGIHTYDTMNGASNHNGIYSLECKIDGDVAFSFRLDEISFEQSKYIHAHMDYEEKLQNRYVMKCYKNRLNPLPIYKADENLGKMYLFEHVPRKVDIVVGDIENNRARISFDIERDPELAPLVTDGDLLPTLRIEPEDSVVLTKLNHTFRINPNTFITPVKLETGEADNLSFSLHQREPIPLFQSISVTSHLPGLNYKNKYVLTRVDKDGKIVNHGGLWTSDTTFVASISSLDEFVIQPDTIAPQIEIVSVPDFYSPRLIFKMTDNFSPASSRNYIDFSVVIDDQWILCDYDLKNDRVGCPVNITMENKERTAIIRAADSVGNRRTRRISFDY